MLFNSRVVMQDFVKQGRSRINFCLIAQDAFARRNGALYSAGTTIVMIVKQDGCRMGADVF